MSTDSQEPGEDGGGSGLNSNESFLEMPIEDELKSSYLTYAMSVIVSRALPDVRDGLKPSQRRILVAMNDLSLTPGSSRVKCAKISGDTSGNYHPHGESIVYPTLVRMAQEWNMRRMLRSCSAMETVWLPPGCGVRSADSSVGAPLGPGRNTSSKPGFA